MKMDLSHKPLNHANKLKKATGLVSGQLAHAKAVEQIRELVYDKAQPTTSKERTELLALAEHLAGESQLHVESKYALAQGAVGRLVRKVFLNEEELLDFLQSAMATNAMVANQIFFEKAHELTALQAAQASGIFTGKLVELKKARVSGFRQETVPVNVLIDLNTALQKSYASTE